MSKLRVKAKLGDQTRAVEWDRQRPLEFAQFKTVLENRFGYRGANLKYRKADGSLQPIYQDFHLEEAAKDASKAGKLFLTIELDGGIAGGPVTNSTTSPYTPPVQSSTPTPAPVQQQQQQQSAPVQSSTPTRGQSNTISSSSNNSRVPAARTNSASRVSEAPVSLQRTGSNTKNNTTASSPSVDKQRRATVAEPPGSDTWSSALGGRTCPECNAPLSPKAKFCPSCGAKTPVGTTGVPAKKQDSSPPATQQQQSQPKAADDEHCAACGLELSGQVAKALDKLWHRDCFTCVTCHKSLISTSFVPDDRGRPMCSDCYETRNLKKCSKCGQAIKSAYMEAGNSTYHKKCFVCSSCNKDLSVGGEYWLKDGSLLCGDHV